MDIRTEDFIVSHSILWKTKYIFFLFKYQISKFQSGKCPRNTRRHRLNIIPWLWATGAYFILAWILAPIYYCTFSTPQRGKEVKWGPEVYWDMFTVFNSFEYEELNLNCQFQHDQ